VSGAKIISIVVPVLNESTNINHLVKRLIDASTSWDFSYEVIFIDDGSTDNTLDLIREMHRKHPNFKYISFSRNFGHQTAVSAGLHHASGDAVVVMDADLQDPPEEIHKLLTKWREGYKVVYGIRQRRNEGIFKKTAYWMFYRILNKLSPISIPLDAGDFCVIDRSAVDHLNALPERNRFVRGLRSWIGFNQIGVPYDRHARFSGEVKYSFKKLLRLAFDGIINFSYRPLQIIGTFGFIVSLLSFAGLVFLAIFRILDISILGYSPKQVSGFTYLVLIIMFIGGLQTLALGVFGEYLGRMLDEVKQRPLYIIKESSDFTDKANTK
jgi:glycosyltransferase involved in cell wall biosynthesis